MASIEQISIEKGTEERRRRGRSAVFAGRGRENDVRFHRSCENEKADLLPKNSARERLKC